MILVEMWGSKVGLVSLGTPDNSRLWILLIFLRNACGQLKYNQKLKNTRKKHAATSQETEQGSCMEVRNAVNRQRIIWFIQGIYYE